MLQANESSTIYHLVEVTIEIEDWHVLATVTTIFPCSPCYHIQCQAIGTSDLGFLEAGSGGNKLLNPKF